MPERIVVSFRGFVPLRGDGAKSYLDRALLLKQQAEAFGANLCAWGSRTFSFDFGVDELEEAISLALLAESERGVARRARFGVGIAQGEMRVVSEGGSLAVLSWGAGLVRSIALARIAGAGEVLVDPRLPAARRGELLSLGARLGLDPGGTVRGLPLDLETPWRRDAAEAVSRLVDPEERVGPVLAANVEIPVGSLGLLRAAAGMGGTRLLADWLDRLRPSLVASGGRALLVRPVWGAALEPFGALRVAIGESLVADGEVLLSPELSSVADDLLAGRGGTPRAVAALLDAVVTGGGESGALAIDRVTRVDAASLTAIAQAMVLRGAFRAICRLDTEELLPRALAPVTLGPAWSLSPLGPADGARLAVGFSGGALDARVAARWARRGEGAPLAIREALAASIVTGELVWRERGLLPQRRSAGRGAPAPASKWILRRLARAHVDEREVLAALAVLGRDALPDELGAIAERATGRAIPAPAIVEELLSKKWLVRWPSGRVQLAADSCRDTLLNALSGPERRRRQAAAAEVVARAAGPCELADATWLALEGGDVDRALGWAEVTVIHLAALGQRADAERVAELFGPHGSAERLKQLIAMEQAGTPETESIPPHDHLADTQQAPASVSPPRGGVVLAEPADSNLETAEMPIATHELVATQLADAARQALRRGDVPGLDGALGQLKSAGGKGDWLAMMSGLAALGRGAKEEALRTLRAAARADLPEPQKTRARLAFAVALGAVGRHEAALFEVLEALAAARETSDAPGELACVRLLSRLSHAAGQPDAAETWSNVAGPKQAVDASR